MDIENKGECPQNNLKKLGELTKVFSNIVENIFCKICQVLKNEQ
jgi:hypothetical protein